MQNLKTLSLTQTEVEVHFVKCFVSTLCQELEQDVNILYENDQIYHCHFHFCSRSKN